MPYKYRLLLKNATVVDPVNQRNAVLDIAVAGDKIADVPFAEVVSFDKSFETCAVAMLSKCDNLDGLLFRLGIEGYDTTTGAVQPGAGRRRF